MNWADIIAERRAADAASNGALSNLPGEGAPPDLSKDLRWDRGQGRSYKRHISPTLP